MQKQKYTGVDYHRRYFYINATEQEGKKVKEEKVTNHKEEITAFLTQAQCNGNSAAALGKP